jgi:hypothetical protein
MPFKKIKYLGRNITKDVNDLYKENYKQVKKEIHKDYRRWKNLPCSGLADLDLVILPKAIYMFMQFL